MSPWERGKRHESWASNPNIAVYIFFLLFASWMIFQVWSRIPGGPTPPSGLDPMVMAALGVAISAKSVEKKQQDKETQQEVKQVKEDLWDLREFARKTHPDEAQGKLPPSPPDKGVKEI